ncbi:MAG: tRNA (adenosine(37)-N6)-threonylcarbamoyltransferase complex transferase subunit TsaD [Chloroflexi bacterium]|nr:tRNA (adenosine(37)-N6)-threonylcarbamoyltransferase complex transferase subunit TsaD [Chloroflexota bacterium]
MLILGIETSCDETAAALVDDGNVLSNVIASQIDLHARFGGIVPEVASRKHVEAIGYVIRETFDSAGERPAAVDAVAVTCRYGLIGSLIVGVSAAKAMAYALKVPLIGIHHIEGHIFANILSHPGLPLPHVCLTVSGGHTMLIHVEEPGRYQVLGGTLDDAAGEAFDKIAKFLGLSFPGGPAIERLALAGDGAAISLPRPLGRSRTADFSFSGLKTAVVNMCQGRDRGSLPLADIAAGFQEAVVDVLVSKTLQAARRLGVTAVSVTGGVSINARLREVFSEACPRHGLQVFFPRPDLCTDNAAMVAAAGAVRLRQGEESGLDLNAVPNAPLESIKCPAKRC